MKSMPHQPPPTSSNTFTAIPHPGGWWASGKVASGSKRGFGAGKKDDPEWGPESGNPVEPNIGIGASGDGGHRGGGMGGHTHWAMVQRWRGAA